MYTVRASLGKSEQVFICYNQLNSFNDTDLSWALKVGYNPLSRVSLIFFVSICYSSSS